MKKFSRLVDRTMTLRQQLASTEKALVASVSRAAILADVLESLVVGLEERFLTEDLLEVEAFNDARELVE